MSLFKDKTGKHMHVNYSEIINWTPILHNKAWLPLTHPPPYLINTLPVSASSLSSSCCSTDSWPSRIRDAKSATITSISSRVLKTDSKRRVQAVGKNLPAFSERVCLCRSSREGRRGSGGLGFQQGRLYFYWLYGKESCLLRSLSAYERKKRELWTGFNTSAWSFHLHLCVLSHIFSDSDDSVSHKRIQMSSHMVHKP